MSPDAPEIQGTASDSTKKAAKHKACNLALKLLVEGVEAGERTWKSFDAYMQGWRFEEYDGSDSATAASSASSSPTSETSGASTAPAAVPQADEDRWNYVGALSEFCARTPTARGPKFEDVACKLIGHSGHAFDVECTLYFIVSDTETRTHSTIGSAPTKKAAKRRAAAQMVRDLVSQGLKVPVSEIQYHKPDPNACLVEEAHPDSNGDAAVEATTEWVVEEEPWGQPSDAADGDKDANGNHLDDGDKSEAGKEAEAEQQEKQDAKQEEERQKEEAKPDYFEQVRALASKMKLQLKIESVPSKTGGHSCVMQAVNEHGGRTATGASQVSFEEAKQEAARVLVKLLKTT